MKLRSHGGRPLVWLLCLLSGCSSYETVPEFDAFRHDETAKYGPTVIQVVEHLKCEMENAELAGYLADDLNKDGSPALGVLAPSRPIIASSYFHYVAFVSLTLEVTNTEGFAPNLSLGRPLDSTGHSESLVLTGQITGTQDRQIVVNFPVTFDAFLDDVYPRRLKIALIRKAITYYQEEDQRLNSTADDSELREARQAMESIGKVDCAAKTAIRGDLGLAEILQDGHLAIHHTNTSLYRPDDQNVANALAGQSTITTISSSNAPFVTQLIFTVTGGIGGGPYLVDRFTGPNSTAGLFNGMRVAKDTAIIEFVPGCYIPQYQAALLDVSRPPAGPGGFPVVDQEGKPVPGVNGNQLHLPIFSSHLPLLRTAKDADGNIVRDPEGNPIGIQWADPNDTTHPQFVDKLRVPELPEDPNSKSDPKAKLKTPIRPDFLEQMDNYWPKWLAKTECPFPDIKSGVEPADDKEAVTFDPHRPLADQLKDLEKKTPNPLNSAAWARIHFTAAQIGQDAVSKFLLQKALPLN